MLRGEAIPAVTHFTLNQTLRVEIQQRRRRTIKMASKTNKVPFNAVIATRLIASLMHITHFLEGITTRSSLSRLLPATDAKIQLFHQAKAEIARRANEPFASL